MEEFTPYPVADQEEARPPLFLDQTEARDRPPPPPYLKVCTPIPNQQS